MVPACLSNAICWTELLTESISGPSCVVSSPPDASAAGAAGRGTPATARLNAMTEVPSGWLNSSRSAVMPVGAGNEAAVDCIGPQATRTMPLCILVPAFSAVQRQVSSFKSVNE